MKPPRKPPGPREIKFGRKIAELRERFGYSQEDVAQLLDLSQKMISDYERGMTCETMQVRNALALARIFGVSVESLFDFHQDLPTREEVKQEAFLKQLIDMLGREAAIGRLAKIEPQEKAEPNQGGFGPAGTHATLTPAPTSGQEAPKKGGRGGRPDRSTRRSG